MKNIIKNMIKILFFGILLFLISFFKISFGLGSYKFFFSGMNLIFPVLGAFFSLPISAALVSSFFIIKKLALGGIITFGIPTLIATLNWSNTSNLNNKNNIKQELFCFLLRVFLPLLCIALFCFHPIGRNAFIYSFYWFIPVVIYFVQKLKKYNSIFFTALTSTFLAHAVGSIIWLYSISMTATMWNALIPIVAIERLVFACGLSLSYLLFKYLNNVLIPIMFKKGRKVFITSNS